MGATVKCKACSRPVSKYAVVCPECCGSVHGRSSQIPISAIAACGVVAGIAWVGIDYLTPKAPTSEQLNELDQQIQQSQQQLDQAQRMLDEAQNAFPKAK